MSDHLLVVLSVSCCIVSTVSCCIVSFKKFRDKQPRSEFFVKVNSHPLFTVTHVRYLGVQFDENISWKYRLDYTVKKVSRKVGVLRRYGRYLTDDARAAYFRCLVQPDLDYCSSTWSDGSQCISKRLESIEKRALRAVAVAVIPIRERTGKVEEIYQKFHVTPY